MPDKNRVTIKIPKPIYMKIATIIEGSSFRSATEFIVYVLRDVVSTHTGKGDAEGLTKEEITAIKDKLKSLGYL